MGNDTWSLPAPKLMKKVRNSRPFFTFLIPPLLHHDAGSLWWNLVGLGLGIGLASTSAWDGVESEPALASR